MENSSISIFKVLLQTLIIFKKSTVFDFLISISE